MNTTPECDALPPTGGHAGRDGHQPEGGGEASERTPLEHARDLLSRGLSPIPVPYKSKALYLTGWQNLRLGADDLPRYFSDTPGNVGTLLGEPAGWIVDVDLDHARAGELTDAFLPATGMVWGRDSKPRSHRLYRLTGPVDTRKWESKTAGMIVELRSTGCQTVAPGSTHPSGESVRWDDDGEPTMIDPLDLIAAIEALADAVLGELGEGRKVMEATTPRLAAPTPRGASNYGREALRREAATVAAKPEGGRNDALNRAAFSLGTLIGGGELDRADAESELLTAARSCGLPDGEARRTIASGIESGMEHPRQRPAKGDATTHGAGNSAAGQAADGDASGESKTPTQADQLVRLAMELCRFGQTAKREPFAVLNGGANVAMRLGGSGGPLRDMLAREYRRCFGRVMSASAFTDACAALRGEAMEADPEPMHLRVGPHGSGVVLDLGTTDGAAVVITAEGWQVVDRSPILFQRTALSGALPKPVRGGDLGCLRQLLNVTDETWPILLGWVVAAVLPEIPHPILMLGGQQGSGKTTAARFVCGLFDPSDAPVRSQPRDPETWAMGAANGWSAVIDNVSNIPEWLSDALCKAVTGDGWVRRTLYTDGDVSVLSFRRVIVLTSIDAGALRGDLGERLVLIDLEPISPERRTTERELQAKYEALRPALLGALLNLVSATLARLDTVKVLKLPRMADFARVLAAVDAALGTGSLGLYADQGKRIAGEVIDADPVGEAVAEFVRRKGEWSGPAGALLGAIKPENAGREWPSNPRGLASRLKRLTPALALQGVKVVSPEASDRTRVYYLGPIAQTARPPEIVGIAADTRVVPRAIASPTPFDRPTDRPHNGVDREATAGDCGLSGGSGGRAQTATSHTPDGWGEL